MPSSDCQQQSIRHQTPLCPTEGGGGTVFTVIHFYQSVRGWRLTRNSLVVGSCFFTAAATCDESSSASLSVFPNSSSGLE